MRAPLRRFHPLPRAAVLLAAAFSILTSAVHAAPSAAREWNEQLLAAIRRNVPNPPGHARNLFHTAVAMYDAWAAYDSTAVGYIYNEKVAVLPADIETARREAVSYAAYRVLRARFVLPSPAPAGAGPTSVSIDAKLAGMGYDKETAIAALTAGAAPAELGKRIGQAILNWGASDGFALISYPQPYSAAVNANLSFPVYVQGENAGSVPNMPLGFGIPAGTDPNLWQPLIFSSGVLQNGIPVGGQTQTFVGVQALATTPFSLTRTDPVKPWIDTLGGPSRLSVPGNPSPTDAAYKDNAMDVLRKSALLNDDAPVDISPASTGNNTIGTDDGTGFPYNPLTTQPWAPNIIKRGDFVRVLAEYWADGPNSETPPGHWHVIANEVSEMPLLQKRVRGTGPAVNDLEWDVKTYFCLSAATHDAACTAWSLKRYYSGARPITMIRYMGSKGQSSDPGQPSYHTQGLPLEPGVVEVITPATTGAGGRHNRIWDVKWGMDLPGSGYHGEIAVYSWPGEHPENLPAPSIATHQSLVRWQLAKDWLPFQRKSFNTPAFPGFTSGHSTFSRAAAEALTLLTGSHLFPGGFHHHTIAANSMQIDLGPSVPVDLQWCSYYDAADQAGQSRRWGGIHPYEDDYIGRQTGAIAGTSAYLLAEKYWSGAILADSVTPAIMLTGGNAVITWNATRGMTHKVQTSPNITDWTDATAYTVAYDTNGTWTDPAPAPGAKFYRVLRSTAATP